MRTCISKGTHFRDMDESVGDRAFRQPYEQLFDISLNCTMFTFRHYLSSNMLNRFLVLKITIRKIPHMTRFKPALFNVVQGDLYWTDQISASERPLKRDIVGAYTLSMMFRLLFWDAECHEKVLESPAVSLMHHNFNKLSSGFRASNQNMAAPQSSQLVNKIGESWQE